jgi:hypothetical protein
MVRRHRPLHHKLLYSASLECALCGRRVRYLRPGIEVPLTRLLSRYTRCPRCATLSVHPLAHRDGIDGVSRNLLSMIAGLTGGHRYHCVGCRLQYFDWRRKASARDARSV